MGFKKGYSKKFEHFNKSLSARADYRYRSGHITLYWRNDRATFVTKGEEAGRAWLQRIGKQNIEELNKVLKKTVTSWENKVK